MDAAVHGARLNQPIEAIVAQPIGYYSAFDASRLWTFFIAIGLVVYGSFRSMRVEQDDNNKDEKLSLFRSQSQSTTAGSTAAAGDTDSGEGDDADSGMQTISPCQALFLPFGASASLLVMFYFFDSLQMLFTVCTGILAMVAFAFLMVPVCQYVMRMFAPRFANSKVPLACFGRYSAAHVLSTILSVSFVSVWVATGHWILMDVLGMGLCVAFIAFIRLPSLKVSTMLLVGLLLYDLFWVFFSSYVFSTNVMMKVATRSAENPIGVLVRKLNLHPSSTGNDSPRLSLPGKLVFPSMHTAGNFSMLGLGDIVMPGLLLCFVLRYDMSRKNQLHAAETGLPPPQNAVQRIKYFHCSLIGYFLGLLTATMSSEFFNAAQPALLYLVPFTLLPLLVMAYLRGDLRRMWSEPFQNTTSLPKYLNV